MNIAIKNISGVNENVYVIRYFHFNGANYLIFTKNEVDESGYQKLYITKVINMVGNGINDEIEWNLLRDTIKVIAKANQDKTTLPVQDLNDSDANGIQVMGEKPFKLTSASASLLSANKSAVVNASLGSEISAPVVSSVGASDFNNNPASVNIPTNDNPGALSVGNNVLNDITMPQGNSLQNDFSNPISSVDSASENLIKESNISSAFMQNPNIANSIVGAIPNADLQPNELMKTEIPMNDIGNNINASLSSNNISQQDLYSDLQSSNDLNNSGLANQNVNSNVLPGQVVAEPVIDYKKLYEEQTLKLNAITVELNKYKNIIEQLKNILS